MIRSRMLSDLGSCVTFVLTFRRKGIKILERIKTFLAWPQTARQKGGKEIESFSLRHSVSDTLEVAVTRPKSKDEKNPDSHAW